MATAKIVYVATDGTQWAQQADAEERDRLDAFVRDLEAVFPKPPSNSGERIAVTEADFEYAKECVVERCRVLFPREAVFKHAAKDIHPMSYAGRFLSESGGPLNRIWWRFCCYRDGYLYDQPFYALNPHEWKPREPAQSSTR